MNNKAITINVSCDGEKSSGKTLVLNILEKALKQHGICFALNDVENHKVKIVLSDNDRKSLGKC